MKNIKLILAMLFIAATITVFFKVSFLGGFFNPHKDETILDSGWEVRKNGEILGIYDFSKEKLLNLESGDAIEISRILEYQGYEEASVRIINRKSDLIVSVDGVNVYSYGVELYDENNFLGEGIHFIQLPHDYAGKRLTITMRARGVNGIGNFIPPVIAPTDLIKINMMKKCSLTLGISLALIVFFFICIGISLMFVKELQKFSQMAFVGLFSFFMGIWSLCNSNLILLFNGNIEAKTFTGYFSLFAAPLFIYLFFGLRDRATMSGTQLFIFRILAGIDSLLMLVFLLLHFTGILYISSTTLVAHIMIVLLLSFMFYMMYDGTKKDKEKDFSSAFEVGMATMCVCAFVDVLLYYLKNYSADTFFKDFNNLSFFGAMMLVVSMILEIGEGFHKTIQTQAELRLYEKLAFIDELTGLSNRRECEEVLDEIDREKTQYAVISLDLNDLKKVNDKFGHEMGDRLIKDFASVLQESFNNFGTVARAGGDEFAVIIKNSAVLNVDKLIEEMERRIGKFNEGCTDYQLSVATGFALWSDEQSSVREALRLADERMYKNKSEMKKAMKGSRG